MNKNLNKTGLTGLVLLGLLSACAESVINDESARVPFIAEQPVNDSNGLNGVSAPTMNFKFNPDSSYDGNPVEAMFPGQGDDSYGVDDIAKQNFRFDLEFEFKEIKSNKEESEKTVVGDASLFIEMIKPVSVKQNSRKKSNKKSNSDEQDNNNQAEGIDIELFRNYESVNGVTVKNVKDIDYLEGRFKDVDGEDTVIVLKAQRKHAKNQEKAQKNPWSGTVYILENSKEIKMGEFKGFFFNNSSQIQANLDNKDNE